MKNSQNNEIKMFMGNILGITAQFWFFNNGGCCSVGKNTKLTAYSGELSLINYSYAQYRVTLYFTDENQEAITVSAHFHEICAIWKDPV